LAGEVFDAHFGRPGRLGRFNGLQSPGRAILLGRQRIFEAEHGGARRAFRETARQVNIVGGNAGTALGAE